MYNIDCAVQPVLVLGLGSAQHGGPHLN